MRRRTAELEQREREVTERAAALESLEEAVAESLSGTPRVPASQDVGSCRLHGGVTRIYENMRPEEAAQILDQLDDETLRVVFARMEPKQIGAIVAAMSRERAVAFTKTLAADGEVAPRRRRRAGLVRVSAAELPSLFFVVLPVAHVPVAAARHHVARHARRGRGDRARCRARTRP